MYKNLNDFEYNICRDNLFSLIFIKKCLIEKYNLFKNLTISKAINLIKQYNLLTLTNIELVNKLDFSYADIIDSIEDNLNLNHNNILSLFNEKAINLSNDICYLYLNILNENVFTFKIEIEDIECLNSYHSYSDFQTFLYCIATYSTTGNYMTYSEIEEHLMTYSDEYDESNLDIDINQYSANDDIGKNYYDYSNNLMLDLKKYIENKEFYEYDENISVLFWDLENKPNIKFIDELINSYSKQFTIEKVTLNGNEYLIVPILDTSLIDYSMILKFLQLGFVTKVSNS